MTKRDRYQSLPPGVTIVLHREFHARHDYSSFWFRQIRKKVSKRQANKWRTRANREWRQLYTFGLGRHDLYGRVADDKAREHDVPDSYVIDMSGVELET